MIRELRIGLLIALVCSSFQAHANCAPGVIPASSIFVVDEHVGMIASGISVIFGDGPAAAIWEGAGAEVDDIVTARGDNPRDLSGFFLVDMTGSFFPGGVIHQDVCIYKDEGETFEEKMLEKWQEGINPDTTTDSDPVESSINGFDSAPHSVYNAQVTYTTIMRTSTACAAPGVCNTTTFIAAGFISYSSTPTHDHVSSIH